MQAGKRYFVKALSSFSAQALAVFGEALGLEAAPSYEEADLILSDGLDTMAEAVSCCKTAVVFERPFLSGVGGPADGPNIVFNGRLTQLYGRVANPETALQAGR